MNSDISLHDRNLGTSPWWFMGSVIFASRSGRVCNIKVFKTCHI